MPEPVALPSVRTKKPGDQGGPIARQGFSYQDDVAVGFVLEMISTSHLTEVWCETQDDIVLVWSDESGAEQAEFVQVKAGSSDKMWSIADVCTRKAKDGVGTSLFERSLSHDCCREESLFCIVTRMPVAPELTVLTYPFGSNGRASNADKLQTICDEISQRYPTIASPKGNSASFWTERCRWLVHHDARAVENANCRRIANLAAAHGMALFPEQTLTVLQGLRSMVKRASDAGWDPEPDVKRLLRTEVLFWWRQQLREMRQAGQPAASRLSTKMRHAQISRDQIQLAVELRREYSAAIRSNSYMSERDLIDIQQSVRGELMALRSKFLAGDLRLTPPQFHAHCVEAVRTLDESWGTDVPGRKALLMGCMYDITDRCLHRFDTQERL